MQVLGLNGANEPFQVVESFARSFGLTFPILLEAASSYYAYGQSPAASPYPLDYVIDQAGDVAYFNTEYDPEGMVTVIDQLIGNVPDIGVDPASVDFGVVGVGLVQTREVSVVNGGTGELVVHEIDTDLADFSVNLAELAVPPGSSRGLLVTFMPQQMGPVVDTLVLRSNDPDAPEVLIPLVGEGGETTAVDEVILPKVISLSARPNPFNPRVALEYDLVERGRVELVVYDIRGRRTRTLLAGDRSSGRHVVQWDGRDDGGRLLPAGEYLIVLETDAGNVSRKVMLVR